jgi:hypothetical protein
MTRGQMRYKTRIGNKIVGGLMRWTYGTTLNVSVKNAIPASAIKRKEDLDNPSTPSTSPSLPLSSQITSSAPKSQEKRKTNQEKMHGLLEQVIKNFSTLISSIQQSMDLLKNMDKNFATLLEKF